jgi:hypothetical protein
MKWEAQRMQELKTERCRFKRLKEDCNQSFKVREIKNI